MVQKSLLAQKITQTFDLQQHHQFQTRLKPRDDQ